MMKTKLTRSVSLLALGHTLLSCSYSMEKDESSSTPAKASSNLSQVMGALRSFMPFQTRGSLHSQAPKQESERQPSTGTSSSSNRARQLSVIGIEPTVPLTDQQVTQFEQNLHHLDRQLEILKITGMEPSEDNRAVRFLSEEDIYQRLTNNQHGRVLDLSNTSFETPKSIRLLEGIAATQSIYEVNLSSCRFTAPAFKALCEALRLNESVRQVYLTNAVLPQGALEGLGEALKYNMTLDHLFLPLDHPFTAEEVSIFYDHIRFNTALAFIGWPQKVLKEVEKQAQTHPTALVHLGFLYSSPLMTMSKPAKDH
ncbi:MAG: hypothetical protein K0M45_03980, partial [Candidatus Paracaedibacteraceae bacterium]|nr:hypothetical protein [Candidatus Paracaedibacteraceae bacterium]